jgi:tetratricopeptide (TPR) repeat protein
MATWQVALELDPMYSHTSLALAGSYVTRGMYDQAIAVLQKALTYTPKDAFLLGALAHAYARAGQREKALRLVGELAKMEASAEIVPPFAMIWAYAGLEDYEQAFARLEKASDERRGRMVWLKLDPRLAPLRADPRFQDLVRRMKLPVKSPQR